MATMPETVTLKIELDGMDEAIAGVHRCYPDLQASVDRLIAMGWTPAMAETFVGEIAEKIVRNMIRVEPADDGDR